MTQLNFYFDVDIKTVLSTIRVFVTRTRLWNQNQMLEVSFRYELILASLWFKLSWVFTSNIVDIRLEAWSRYVLTSRTWSIVSLCHDWSIVRDQVWSGMISSNGINYLGIMRTRANYYLTGVCTSVQCLHHCNSQCWHWTHSNKWKILFELHLLSIYICDSDNQNYKSKY